VPPPFFTLIELKPENGRICEDKVWIEKQMLRHGIKTEADQ